MANITLTPREQTIALRIMSQQPKPAIATALNIELKAVNKHVASIRRKMAVGAGGALGGALVGAPATAPAGAPPATATAAPPAPPVAAPATAPSGAPSAGAAAPATAAAATGANAADTPMDGSKSKSKSGYISNLDDAVFVSEDESEDGEAAYHN